MFFLTNNNISLLYIDSNLILKINFCEFKIYLLTWYHSYFNKICIFINQFYEIELNLKFIS